jgi:hypothetical protein
MSQPLVWETMISLIPDPANKCIKVLIEADTVRLAHKIYQRDLDYERTPQGKWRLAAKEIGKAVEEVFNKILEIHQHDSVTDHRSGGDGVREHLRVTDQQGGKDAPPTASG